MFTEGPCKEMVGSCLKPLNLLKACSKASFLERWGRGMVNCCELLGSDPLFLKSGHDQVNVTLNKSYSLFFWQEGTRSQVQLSLLRALGSGWEEAELSVKPSGPGPETLVIAEGARHPGPNWPLSLSGCPYGRGRSQNLTQADGRYLRSQRQDAERFIASPRLGQPCEGSGALQTPSLKVFPGPLSSLTAWGGWSCRPIEKRPGIFLLPHFYSDNHHFCH